MNRLRFTTIVVMLAAVAWALEDADAAHAASEYAYYADLPRVEHVASHVPVLDGFVYAEPVKQATPVVQILSRVAILLHVNQRAQVQLITAAHAVSESPAFNATPTRIHIRPSTSNDDPPLLG